MPSHTDPHHIPWFQPQLDEREYARVAAVLASNYINDGAVTREFEKRLADRIGVTYCVAVTSGTAAIALALMGLGIGPGDEVIVPDLTFVATANAARLAGATVRLVDVEPERFTLDPEAARGAITPRTAAIVTVDVNGRAADYDTLQTLCRAHDLFLLCDAAEGFGSGYRGEAIGTFGDAACFSFSANKTVTSGQGGLVATNSDTLHDRLRELKDQGRRLGGTGGDDIHPVLGFNFKYTNLQAAIGIAQLEKLDERIAHFHRRDQWYRQYLAACPGIRFPARPNWQGEVLQWTDILCEDRTAVQTALQRQQIDSRAFWLPVHRQLPYQADDGDFPVTVKISAGGLWLPSSFELTEQQVRRVADVIRAAVERDRFQSTAS
jgi:perosamine synthetase